MYENEEVLLYKSKPQQQHSLGKCAIVVVTVETYAAEAYRRQCMLVMRFLLKYNIAMVSV